MYNKVLFFHTCIGNVFLSKIFSIVIVMFKNVMTWETPKDATVIYSAYKTEVLDTSTS